MKIWFSDRGENSASKRSVELWNHHENNLKLHNITFLIEVHYLIENSRCIFDPNARFHTVIKMENKNYTENPLSTEQQNN